MELVGIANQPTLEINGLRVLGARQANVGQHSVPVHLKPLIPQSSGQADQHQTQEQNPQHCDGPVES